MADKILLNFTNLVLIRGNTVRYSSISHICMYVHYIHIIVHIFYDYIIYIYLGWHEVAQLVEALCYRPEGRGFDSPYCHWIFLIDLILPAAL
jgi:hypothetical protein